jgi:hypothetical protein
MKVKRTRERGEKVTARVKRKIWRREEKSDKAGKRESSSEKRESK